MTEIKNKPNKIAPRHRNRRLVTFFGFAIVTVGGAVLLVSAIRANTQFFHSPSGVVAEGFVPSSQVFRVGGYVEPGSVVTPGELRAQFIVRDFENPNSLPDMLGVRYDGVLPDLFREGEGVVMTGSLADDGIFIADEVLAKHDNEYSPKLPESGT